MLSSCLAETWMRDVGKEISVEQSGQYLNDCRPWSGFITILSLTKISAGCFPSLTAVSVHPKQVVWHVVLLLIYCSSVPEPLSSIRTRCCSELQSCLECCCQWARLQKSSLDVRGVRASCKHGDKLLCCNYEGWHVNCCYASFSSMLEIKKVLYNTDI